MKLLSSLDCLSPDILGTAVTMGNFDGVHLGHQALLSQLKERASEFNFKSALILFEPQPSEFFFPEQAKVRLSSLREKLDYISTFNIDYVLCLKFTAPLASMTAEVFAKRYFFSFLKARTILVGADFRFGRQRQGDLQLLKQLGEKNNCEVDAFADYAIANQRVSSTMVRRVLAQADFISVQRLLGRPYKMMGRVMPGQGFGREWGVPTANLYRPQRLNPPFTGVFCVKINHNGFFYQGVANLGKRPTLNGQHWVLEVHLLDINLNLYGAMLEVVFLKKLRDEIKFSSLEALITQIYSDITQAKQFFEQEN